MTYYFFFYLFFSLSVISSLLAVFSNKDKNRSFYCITFVLSVSVMLSLINSGYLSFIIITISAGLYSYYSIKLIPDETNNMESESYPTQNKIHLVIIALNGALIASLLGSTMWQGKVFLRKEITLANFAEAVSGEYFIFFLVIFIAAFLISSNLKQPDMMQE